MGFGLTSMTNTHFEMNKNSYISIGAALTILCAVLGASTYLAEKQSRSEILVQEALNASKASAEKANSELSHYKEIATLNSQVIVAKIDGLVEQIKSAGADRYTGHDHKLFTDRLQELNPELKVPKTDK